MEIKLYRWVCPICGHVIELPQPDYGAAVVDHKISHEDDED